MTPVIIRVFGALLETVAAAPVEMACSHVGAVADAEQQRALVSVFVFVHFAGRMDDEGARHDVDRFARRAHYAAALETEIDFGRVRVAVIGADLAGLPACHRDVAVPDLAEDFFDVFFRIELGLADHAEGMHRNAPWKLPGPKSALRGGKNDGERFLACYLYRFRRYGKPAGLATDFVCLFGGYAASHATLAKLTCRGARY